MATRSGLVDWVEENFGADIATAYHDTLRSEAVANIADYFDTFGDEQAQAMAKGAADYVTGGEFTSVLNDAIASIKPSAIKVPVEADWTGFDVFTGGPTSTLGGGLGTRHQPAPPPTTINITAEDGGVTQKVLRELEEAGAFLPGTVLRFT